jgi:putative oxidoreductase
MNSSLQNLATLLGRILIAVLFVPAGLEKITGFQGTVGYIVSVAHFPLPAVAAAVAIVVELGGGIALLAGWQARWAALALAVFSVVTAFGFHAFWAAPEAQKMIETIEFFKDLGLAGGLLFIFAFGPGAYSVDARGTPR